ncbi:MAG: ABC transporter substrate-binding protein [bacterium]
MTRGHLLLGGGLVQGAAALVVAALAGAGTPLATTEGAAAPAGYTVELSPVGVVHFPRPPRRAVTLDAQYEDMLVALGVGDRLVATGYEGNHHDGFYAEIPGLTPGIDRAGLKLIGVGLDKELLYALRAEVHHIDPERLVAMPGWTRTDIAEITQNLGPFFANRYSREQSYPGDRPYTYYTAFELAARVGQVYQRGDRIAALEAIYDALVARIQVDLPPPEERPRVGLVTYARGHFTPFSVDRPGFGTAHLRAVGARDAFAAIRDRTYADAGRGTALDVEGLLALDPDVIIMPFAVFASFRARFAELQALADDPVAGRLTAMKAGRVYPGGTPLQGPIFLIFQTEMAAKQLYPDRFGPYRPAGDYPEGEWLFDRRAVARALAGRGA